MKRYSPAYLNRAHDASSLNEAAVKASDHVGCFSCCEVYAASEVTSWITERCGGKTAICPRCKTDAVLASSSGYPLTREFLSVMEERWFAYHNHC